MAWRTTLNSASVRVRVKSITLKSVCPSRSLHRWFSFDRKDDDVIRARALTRRSYDGKLRRGGLRRGARPVSVREANRDGSRSGAQRVASAVAAPVTARVRWTTVNG